MRCLNTSLAALPLLLGTSLPALADAGLDARIQAQDKYVRVVTGDSQALIRTPLKQLAAGLDSNVFWQVHRAVVVRVAAVHSVRRDELGHWQLRLRGRAETLPVSAGFAQRFRAM